MFFVVVFKQKEKKKKSFLFSFEMFYCKNAACLLKTKKIRELAFQQKIKLKHSTN